MPPRDAGMSLRLWKLEACGNSAPSSSCLSSATCSTIFSKNDTDSPVPQRKPPRSSISAQLQRLHEFSSLSDLTPSTAQLDKVGESQLCAGGRSGRGVYDAEGFFFGSGDETVEEEEGHGGEPRTKQRGRPRTLPPRMAVPSSSSSSCGTSTAAGHVRGPYEPLVLSSPDDPAVIEVPASINSRLFDYQKEGVKFLYNLYKKNIGGVLGDDMGLGKTIQTIAFLSAVIREKTCKTGINDCKGASPSHLNKDGPVLIVCPTSVINNWGNEFAGWGNFNYSLYHGPNRDLVLEKLANGSVDILITSFDTFRNQSQTICKIDWDIVIVDEAHRLKNEKSQLYNACLGFKTRRRYGLTGTIMQNKILELFNLFDWISPGSLGTREHFRDFYDEPLKHGQRLSAPERFIQIADERKQHLSDVLRKYLLRRTKAETIGHLMLGKEDNVVFCTMSEVQKRAYRRMLAQPEIQCLINKDLACSCGSPLKQVECCKRIVPNGILWSYLHKDNPDGCESCPFCLVLPCILKLQQISNHLELIKPNPRDEMEKQKKDAELASAILDSDVKLIGGNTQIENFMELSDVEHCGKMRALEKLMFMWLSNGDKILLFSYSVRMLNILEKFLIRKGYCFSRLDGSTPMTSRQSLVDDFNNSPSKQVFLISTRAGGLGLNLVSANRVVIFDPNWNPAHDLQAQDRSFRFGQKRHVIVFRLLAAGSVEELVYYRQVYKQQLSNIAVAGKEEKRYFEGVQDCKEFKGELFGISNIFRDLVDKLSTNEITELHENRQNYNGEENDTLLSVNMENEARLDELGIEYSHRNEDVVNMRPGTSRDKDTGVSVNDDRPLFVKHTGSEHSAVSVLNEKRSLWKWKRDEYAHIAQFLGMNELDLSRWILSAPPSELSELLQKYKEWKLH